MAYSENFTFDFFKIAENFLFVFCAQSAMNRKVRHNLTCQPWKEIRLVTLLKKIFLATVKLNKSPHLFKWHFYTLLKIYCHAKRCNFATS